MMLMMILVLGARLEVRSSSEITDSQESLTLFLPITCLAADGTYLTAKYERLSVDGRNATAHRLP